VNVQAGSQVTRGVLLALGTYFIYSCSDATIKALGTKLGIFEISFYSTLFSLVPMLLAKPADERWGDAFRFHNPRLMLLIGVLRVASGLLVTYSFVTIPLAEVYAIVFLIPVIITILSVIVLREQVGPERWALVIISFLGVLLVVRPGFRDLELGHLTAVGCAICAAVATTLTRMISGRENRIALFLVPTVFTVVASGILMIVVGFGWPDWSALLLLIVCGALGGLGFVLQINALTIAPASRIAPTQYTQIVWALILGALFFAEFPDTIALVGLAIVIAAGIVNIVADGARARIAGRWNAYRARKLTTPDDASRIAGPPEG
jgi:drug/metabolite transporter (DMT)-like permease